MSSVAFKLVDEEMRNLVVRTIRKPHRIRHAARLRRGDVEPRPEAETDESDALFGDGFEEQRPHRQFILALERITEDA